MLQDPDNFEDDAIEITANNDAEAQRKGERLADLRSDAQTIVKCLGCRRRTKTTGKYICTLRIEMRPAPEGDNR
ncbi:MAG: hypothetical protein KME17_17770 [Cyanosarcina radialis HA8281-LM2]|nr:hypothetical protein [Cyanosarcina radialis HA8281-LM2]